jgi:transcriptional regulator with XRE-family HTH domain
MFQLYHCTAAFLSTALQSKIAQVSFSWMTQAGVDFSKERLLFRLMAANRPGSSRSVPRSAKPVPSTVRRTGQIADAAHSPKKPNRIDKHVAQRLRMRRALVGISQDELAKRLRLTSQQVQKYEAGETRISASRLYDIAQQLAVPITWFFDELDEDKARRPSLNKPSLNPDAAHQDAGPDLAKLISRPDVQQLVKLYFDIADERLRKKVIEVTTILKKTESE